ncbi:MAG: DNA polymerase III subunit beta [marine bacterium B5-7]|nr:MAG: DNA polymerase III subunit beta [marine bacterium B5-7]
MKFKISREALLKPLQLISGVVERKQTLPILANVLLRIDGDKLVLMGTDLEVELQGIAALESVDEAGETTVPARKLMDICKALPEGVVLQFSQTASRVTISAGKSRFTLSFLPTDEFPYQTRPAELVSMSLSQAVLRELIDRVYFSMANQDVRYYLNGLLVEMRDKELRCVATNGHRMAMSREESPAAVDNVQQAIIPRKGVLELLRLLQDTDEPIQLQFGQNHLQATGEDFVFYTKLIDGRFPDYERVIPKGGDKEVVFNRKTLKEALARVAILSNEKYHGVALHLRTGSATLVANNPDQEEAEEVMAIDYDGVDLEMGFNVTYLLEALNSIPVDDVKFTLLDANHSTLIEGIGDGQNLYVVMPMRL